MMVNINKASFNISLSCEVQGRRVLSSTSLNAGKIKDVLRLAVQDIVIIGEINVDKWVINLGVIPMAQFDTLFISRLGQAFAERLPCEQASIAGQRSVKMAASNATELSVLFDGDHHDSEGLIQLAHCCLTPQIFKTLLQDSPTYQLQQLLKLLLEGAWQSSKMLPVCWYSRVTPGRLSLAAVLYLLKSQRGHDWLMYQHSPTASQVTGWTKAIARGEIPPEQVMQLLTGNQPSDSILRGQSAYPPLFVMRWLLPLWRQPAVRQVIYRLKGELGVQHLDNYLGRCLQRQGDDAMHEKQGRHTDPHQALLSRDDPMHEEQGRHTDPHQALLSRDDAIHEEQGRHTDPHQVVLLRDDAKLLVRKGGLRSPNAPRSSSQEITNAGLLLLWPLLPQLFYLLGLWEEQQFVSDAARWQAVYGLDRLVWGDVSPTEGRLTLNQVLCEVSCSTSVPPSMPLSLLQLQQIDDWLAAIGQQLPVWQKLSLTDIRQLFLQRTGEISIEGPVPQISVWPEPYDFLLRDWPWPMTLASFPWTEQPLIIVWPLDGFTG